MQISYDAKTDLLYLRLDDAKQDVVNRRLSDDVVLDIGADDKIVGIEILDASEHVRMDKILPVQYPTRSGEARLLAVRERPRSGYKTK